MHKINRREQRRALYGWIPYAPLVAMVFGVLFCDAWLNIQTRQMDYELGRLNRRMRELRSELDSLRGEQAEREGIGLLGAKAAALGLVEPEPWQIMRICYDKRSVFPPQQAPLTMAHLNAEEDKQDDGDHPRPVATILLDAPETPPPLSGAVSPETAAPAFFLTRAPLPSNQQECLSAEGELLLSEVMAAINQARADIRPEPAVMAVSPQEEALAPLPPKPVARSLPAVPPQSFKAVEDAVLAPLLADLQQELHQEWKLLNTSL